MIVHTDSYNPAHFTLYSCSRPMPQPGLATIEEGKAIIENYYCWPDFVVNLHCVKEQETAEGTVELLEKYQKLAEATVLRG